MSGIQRFFWGGLLIVSGCVLDAMVHSNTEAQKNNLLQRIADLKLLPTGELADKHLITDINLYADKLLSTQEADRLSSILIDDSRFNTSYHSVLFTVNSLEKYYEDAVEKGLFGSVVGESKYLTATTHDAYDVYIPALRKIAELKKARGI